MRPRVMRPAPPNAGPAPLRGLGQPEPQHVHRGTELPQPEAGVRAQPGVATVGRHRQVRTDLVLAVAGGPVADPGHLPVLAQQADRIGVHPQLEVRIAPRPVGQEVEEVPLRHEREEGEPARQAAEVGQHIGAVVGRDAQLGHLLVRQLEEVVGQPQLVEQAQGRGMDGVPPEVPQEVAVLLQHHHLQALAGEEEPEHHPRRSTAGDATVHLGHADLPDIRRPGRAGPRSTVGPSGAAHKRLRRRTRWGGTGARSARRLADGPRRRM